MPTRFSPIDAAEWSGLANGAAAAAAAPLPAYSLPPIALPVAKSESERYSNTGIRQCRRVTFFLSLNLKQRIVVAAFGIRLTF